MPNCAQSATPIARIQLREIAQSSSSRADSVERMTRTGSRRGVERRSISTSDCLRRYEAYSLRGLLEPINWNVGYSLSVPSEAMELVGIIEGFEPWRAPLPPMISSAKPIAAGRSDSNNSVSQLLTGLTSQTLYRAYAISSRPPNRVKRNDSTVTAKIGPANEMPRVASARVGAGLFSEPLGTKCPTANEIRNPAQTTRTPSAGPDLA